MTGLPRLKNAKKKTKKYLYSFGGINKGIDFDAGELETSENVGFESYPALSVRRKRVKTSFGTAQDLFYANGMIKIYNAKETTDSETGEVSRTCNISYKKETASSGWSAVGTLSADADLIGNVGKSGKEAIVLGDMAVVFPDKKYLDLNKTYSGWVDIEATVSYSKDAANVWNNKMVFTSSTHFSSFKDKFKVGDVVDFSGGYYVDNKAVRADGKKIIRDISSSSDRTVTFDPYSFGSANNNYSAPMTFTKTVPELTNLCVWNGRLWGIDADNNICASKYMNPTVFEYFDLSSADSYTMETDTTGDFTGVAALGNHIAFFKENKIHRISGTKPSNYRHTILDTTGVKKGAERSVAKLDEAVYYCGGDGVYVYDGGTSEKISEKLGTLTYSSAVGGIDGSHYLLSLADESGENILYCYDVERNLWLREDNLSIKAAFNYLGSLHYLAADGNIYNVQAKPETGIEFSVTLREMEENFSEKKGYSRLYLSYNMSEGGRIKVEVCYSPDGTNRDGADSFETVGIFTNHRKNVSEIRLSPNRTDYIRLRITATSDVVVRRVMREYHTYRQG